MRECRGGPSGDKSRSRSPINVSFIVMEEVWGVMHFFP